MRIGAATVLIAASVFAAISAAAQPAAPGEFAELGALAQSELKAINAPGATIAIVCPAKLHDLWRHNPFINEIIPFTGEVDTRVLRQKKFNTAIIFPNSFRTAWECWRAGIPRRQFDRMGSSRYLGHSPGLSNRLSESGGGGDGFEGGGIE